MCPAGPSEVLRLEHALEAHFPAGDHELPVASIVHGTRHLGRYGGVGLDDLEDEEPVLGHYPRIDDLALEARVALPDEWRVDLGGPHRCEGEFLEFVDVGPRAVADADHLLGNIEGRNVDH